MCKPLDTKTLALAYKIACLHPETKKYDYFIAVDIFEFGRAIRNEIHEIRQTVS